MIGAGLVGLLAGRFAQLDGAYPLLVLDPAVDSTPSVLESVAPGGVHVLIEATGAPRAFVPALAMARPGGRVVLLGSTRGQVEGFSPYDHAHLKGLSIIGAHVSTTPVAGTPRDPWTEAANRRLILALMQDKRLEVEPLVSHTIVPEQAADALAGLAHTPEKYLGIAIDWKNAQL